MNTASSNDQNEAILSAFDSNSDSDSDSDSSGDDEYDDDEEFLTSTSSKKKNQHVKSSEDREALIRRKLLESFYGKDKVNSVDANANANANTNANADGGENNGQAVSKQLSGLFDDNTNNNSARTSTNNQSHLVSSNTNPGKSTPSRPTTESQYLPSPQSPSTTDLDSPSFNPRTFSQNLIQNSSTHILLSNSSNLTQSIRLLDSTMQTLVYENYSKFIDATDAIRSIGQSVSISENGLSTLQTSMHSIETNMKQMEDQLHTRRNQVADKLRTKRLLQRLTRLLELPKTLQEQKREKKYRCVMKDYYDAMSIIGQYSDGFESLKNIEGDCGCIVEGMVWELGMRVWVWCGGDDRGRLMMLGNGTTGVTGGFTRSISGGGGGGGSVNKQVKKGVNGGGTIGIMGVSTTLDTFIRNGRMLFQISAGTTTSGNHLLMNESMQDDNRIDDDDDDDDDDGIKNNDDREEIKNHVDNDDSLMRLSDDHSNNIHPPQSISEIFECAGALMTYQMKKDGKLSIPMEEDDDDYNINNDEDVDDDEEDEGKADSTSKRKEAMSLLSQLQGKECKVISLECCTKFLDGILEDHAIDVQEEKLKSIQQVELQRAVANDDDDAGADDANSKSKLNIGISTYTLFPRKFLDTMLEAATLYGVTFNLDRTTPTATTTNTLSKKKKKRNHSKKKESSDNNLLNEYISNWFESFMRHVRMVLLDRIADIDSMNRRSEYYELSSSTFFLDDLVEESKEQSASSLIDDGDDDEDDAAFAEISKELMTLLRNVREAASGLALPEVGLDVEVASSLVEQTVGVTESMVKQRVTQKFNLLRIRVLKECLVPLVKDIVKDTSAASTTSNVPKDIDSMNVIKTVQAANVALSDGMQMVDDTIRSVLSRGSALGASTSSNDVNIVKVAVKNDARKFAFWLATTLEIIAGSEPNNADITLHVNKFDKENDNSKSEEEEMISSTLMASNYIDEDEGESHEKVKEKAIIDRICEFVYEHTFETNNGVLILALVEMSRLAERNVSNNMSQSILFSMEESSMHGSKKDSFHLSSQQDFSNIDFDGLISTRFRVAAARSLVLYASIQGNEAASSVCQEIWESCAMQSEFLPHGPTESSWKILEVAKATSLDCAAAFGGDVRAGPIPSFQDESDYMHSGAMSSMGGARHGAMKGLSLDVARMFSQRVQVYPHHTQMVEFSRNAVVALMLKIALKAWIEQIRSCTFTTFAYRQIQVDIEFIKVLLPHYVEEVSAYMEELQSILGDVVLNAGERCKDIECVGVNEYYDEARGKVLNPSGIALGFLMEEEAAGKRGILHQFLIQDGSSEVNDDNDDDVMAE